MVKDIQVALLSNFWFRRFFLGSTFIFSFLKIDLFKNKKGH